MGLSSFVKNLLGRNDEEPREEVEDPFAFLHGVEGRVPISRAPVRQVSTVAGRVVSVESSPEGKPARFQSIIEDSSGGRLTLVWLGRRSVFGICEGAALSATGTVAVAKGTRGMVDPAYTLISEV